MLVTVLLVVVVVLPVVAEFGNWDATSMGLTIVVIGVSIARGRTACRAVIVSALVVLALVWICTLNPNGAFEGFHFLAVAGLLLFSAGVTSAYLLKCQEIDQETLAAAAAVYLLFGLACGAVYATFSAVRPGGLEFPLSSQSPSFHDHVYFSFVVLTTIGFGDVVPRDALNRSMVMLEGIAGLFYMAMVVSRLVSLYRQPLHPLR